MDMELLRADLKRDEGLRLKPYQDTVGKTTIGYGRNLSDVGITDFEASLMLDSDMKTATDECEASFDFWPRLGEPQQRGLCNMAFNMGMPRLEGFVKMLAALDAGDYETAADEALNSKWADQVGDRAYRIADLYRSGT